MSANADIIATGQGFGSTQVEFRAVSEAGKVALQTMGGGFACVGMTVRKSYCGDYLSQFEGAGCVVKWEG